MPPAFGINDWLQFERFQTIQSPSGARAMKAARELPRRARAGSYRVAPKALPLLLWVVLLFTAQSAQGVTARKQVERLQRINAFLLDFRSGAAPSLPEESWRLELALDLIPQPQLDTRVGAKDEPVNAPPLVPRPRLRLLGSSGWLVGGSWSPPVQVQGFQADLLGVELGWHWRLGSLLAGMRAHWLNGSVLGPITADNAEDQFQLENSAADLRAGWLLGGWTPYVGLGVGESTNRLQVESDKAQLEFSGAYRYRFFGISRQLGSLILNLEQHATGDFLRHLIVTVAYGI